ncbi:MAG: circadian clock protein KaiA [Scytonema hyalinum WJT4-NPBG1]|nr:circadian clock protein KaiA [Scytonema hyalinum WJT4-NPBG1]
MFQYLLNWLQKNLNKVLSFNCSYALKWHKLESHQFFQQMTTRAEQQALLQQLKSDYRQILINYFITTDKTLKEKIDKFIHTVFYGNIPVPQIIEIHMELIEEFSQQLKLEGRSDEGLLDYRLTLIDILAHLCELYRCSIPK